MKEKNLLQTILTVSKDMTAPKSEARASTSPSGGWLQYSQLLYWQSMVQLCPGWINLVYNHVVVVALVYLEGNGTVWPVWSSESRTSLMRTQYQSSRTDKWTWLLSNERRFQVEFVFSFTESHRRSESVWRLVSVLLIAPGVRPVRPEVPVPKVPWKHTTEDSGTLCMKKTIKTQLEYII